MLQRRGAFRRRPVARQRPVHYTISAVPLPSSKMTKIDGFVKGKHIFIRISPICKKSVDEKAGIWYNYIGDLY
jgi:hypothetical protein